jgi:4-amino-4-deoxy-L-arabinose transferase-like glycosyltransferase
MKNFFHSTHFSLRHAFLFIAILSVLRLIYLLFIPVTPQEAYYWYYIQHPALSYFDHPPMAAYSIGLGTLLFGNTVFGVKVMAVVWFAGINFLFLQTLWLLFLMFKPQLSNEQISRYAFFGLVLFNLAIFTHLYAITMVPDTPLLYFWILTLHFFIKLIQTHERKWWFSMGLAIGLGLVSKYTMIAIVPALFTALLLKKDLRRYLITPYPYLMLLIAAVIFSPVIIWNAQHHWASFGFQFEHRAEKLKPFTSKYIIQLFFSQLFILTPLVFGFLIDFIVRLVKNRFRDPIPNVLFISGFFIIGGFLYISLKSLVKMNWLLPGYLGWILGAVLLFVIQGGRVNKWIKAGGYFSVFLLIVAYLILLIPNMPLGEGNTWSGWKDAAQKIYKLQEQMGGKKQTFIFANSYKSASLLKFYLPDHQDTYAQNIYGRPALQFDIWGTPDSLKGKNALYIFDDRKEYKNDLRFVTQYFDTVFVKTKFEYTFMNRWHTRTIYCYEARNYHGRN